MDCLKVLSLYVLEGDWKKTTKKSSAYIWQLLIYELESKLGIKGLSSKSSWTFFISIVNVILSLGFINYEPHYEDIWEWRYSSTIFDLSTRWRWVVSFMA
jgi:hypothetical protein